LSDIIYRIGSYITRQSNTWQAAEIVETDRLKTRALLQEFRPGKKKKLIAGPFIGEFGWEVAQFQGFIRFLSRFYKEVEIISRLENSYLYQDFCDSFIAHDPGSYETNYYSCKDPLRYIFPHDVDADILEPEMVGQHLNNFFIQNFRVFGEEVDAPEFDVVIHGRYIPMSDSNKAGRNWPADHWDILVQYLLNSGYKVAAIGLPELSICPVGVEDFRGADLRLQCGILNRARVCVGPSSGAMHLASHCSTPLVVWTVRKDYQLFGGSPQRYIFSWNPHSAEVIVLIHDFWLPEPQDVYDSVKIMLTKKQAGFPVYQYIDLHARRV
jgi:hypothetical protein